MPGCDCGGTESAGRLAQLLAAEHAVKVVSPEPDDELRRISFASEDHRRSAAALAAIERFYAGTAGPDHLEFCDRGGAALVAQQARRAGHPLLANTRIAVRACGSVELTRLHDGVPADRESAIRDGIEREALRLADILLWPGGEALDLYRRFYADLALPEPVFVPPPPPARPSAAPAMAGGPLRLLFLSELSRSAGALDLADACRGLADDGWTLTMLGRDTKTAPLGRSARTTIEAMWPNDARLDIGTASVGQIEWGAYDLAVVPARFDLGGEAISAAMAAGLPVLATPVGIAPELVEPGVTGWLSDGIGSRALRASLDRLLGERQEVARLRGSAEIGSRVREFHDPDAIRAAYRSLPTLSPPTRSAGDQPLVTALVPFYRSARFAEEAVSSLLGQSYENLEVLLIDDGSFAAGDQDFLDSIAADPRTTVVTQLNEGVAAARNLGILLARGRYVAPLDADNAFEPEFVARAVAMLEEDPELAYVTSWLRYLDTAGEPLGEARGYAPLGNSVLAGDEENWDGDAISVIRRDLVVEPDQGYDLELVLHEDWDLYRRLRASGRYGAVIPEQLARYRVRPDSSLRTHSEAIHEYGRGEEVARRRLRASGLGGDLG